MSYRTVKLLRFRQGGLYIATLLSSLLVACLALAALQSVRVQRRMVDDQSEISNARYAAITGMESCTNYVRSNTSSWRLLASLFNNVTTNITGGTFKSNFDDPYDNNLADNSYDPLQLTIEGKSDTATQKATMLLYPEQRPYEACRNAIHAAGAIAFNAGTTTTNQWITSNTNMVRNAGSINSDCAAAGAFNTTAGFNGIQTTNGTWPREMPVTASGSSSSRISAYYDSNSVAIDIEDIPDSATELLTNPSFENATLSPWTTYGVCTAALSTAQFHDGAKSASVTTRIVAASGIQQSIPTSNFQTGQTYKVSAWIRPTSASNMSIRLVVVSSTGTQNFTTSAVAINSNTWGQVTGDLAISWTGSLTSVTMRIISSNTASYFVDETSVKDNSATQNHVIEEVLLSAASNPYGSGTTDAEGIYEIDVEGGNLVIQDCRIRGTLLIKNAATLRIASSVNWEPAVYNYPILLSTGTIILANSNTNLVESAIGTNLNPASTPYNGTSNTTTTDTYPSTLNGLIYAAGDIQITGNVTVNGQITTHGSINMSGPSLTVNFPSWLLHDPPPGYRPSSPSMIPAVETFQYIP
jgi:hypothetical protein